jgi:hypothetical protein|tara:strand:- start:486 stop:617 length:132 start_codon:yes stop_codon:yes gene_type:complete
LLFSKKEGKKERKKKGKKEKKEGDDAMYLLNRLFHSFTTLYLI